MDTLFKNKVEFNQNEIDLIALLKSETFYYNPTDQIHKRLKPAITSLFFRGLLDRGDKAINHYVLNELGQKALDWNNAVEFFNS